MNEIRGILKHNEDLLDKMENVLKNEKSNFVRDGLLYRGEIHYCDGCWERHQSTEEESLWLNSPIKVMFLMKDYTNESMNDIRYETGRKNYIKEGQSYIKRDAFTMNIVYWLYGLTHLTYNVSALYSEIKDGYKCFHFYEMYPLLRINCKKISGGSTCDNKTLQNYLENIEYSQLLSQQISLFDANIIVCCGGGGRIASFVKEQCYSTDSWQQFEKESLWYNKNHDKLIFDSYHPSCRYSRQELFEGIIGCYQRFVEENQYFQKKLDDMKEFEENILEQRPFQVIYWK